MRRKNKNIAGILAFLFGWLGAHRYYLGEQDKGMFYTIGSMILMMGIRLPFIGGLMRVFWIPFVLIVSLIDAITFFAMDEKSFDEKYNKGLETQAPNVREERHRAREERYRARREEKMKKAARKKKEYVPPKTSRKKALLKANSYKKSGIEKFNDYDYAGAIGEFKKSIEIAPNDIASHFNIACAYSLTEQADLAFHHLDTAVALGFKDFDKIKNHHALAWLRIQPDFEEFEENGFRLRKTAPDAQPIQGGSQQEEDLLSTRPDLLDQLKKLDELRNKGLLTEIEFIEQKKKLLR